MKKLIRQVFALIIIFMIWIQFLFPTVTSVAYATAEIDVNVMASPIIDIVLAKSKTKTDVNSFEEDLKKELINQNILPDKIKINAVEAVEANIQDSFAWETDVSSKIGSIQITNEGQNIVMKGNNKNLGKNAIWIIPEKEQEQEIKFDYSVDFGDSFNAAGMLLRVKQTNNTLTGYMLSLNKSGKTWYKTAGNKYGAIWKFTYNIGTNTSNMTKTFVQGLDISTKGTLNIKSTDTKIAISGGGLKSTVEYTMDAEYGHGFGFFSDHYSHNCSNIGAFTLGNISLTTTTVKKFDEVLSNPEWRENSLRFLVNVDDNENEELQNKASLASLQTSLINEQINSVFWGTEKNQSQSNKIIQANNNNGIFINNTDYTNAIISTAKYIKTLIDSSSSSQYAIVGEEVELKVTPESAKVNTVDDDYPYGKWKINHDYEYFENNLGQFKEHGKYMSDLTLSFDKTGRYEILYEDASIQSKYIYVHRKPVANFVVSKIGGAVTLTSTSYDLDCYSNNNGIAEEEWKYRTTDESDWTIGKLENIEPDKVYVTQLRVKDFQETWSTPMTQYVMYDSAEMVSIPVSYFTVKNTTISKYENLEIENTSYDPAGIELTDEIWTIKDDKNVLYTGKTLLNDYSTYEEGTYTISLVVINKSGNSSKEFSRKIQIIGDNIAPEITATPTNASWTNEPVTVNLKLSDQGGSKVKGYRYQITDSQEMPMFWNEMDLEENNTITIDIEGEKYLHIIAYDNDGNESADNIFGKYYFDFTLPELISENEDDTEPNLSHIKFEAKDDTSGIQKFTVNGNEVNGTEYIVTKNGTYNFEILDNAGNLLTKSLTINNLYDECTEKLGHNIYSTSHEKCPICDLIDGIKVNTNKKTYGEVPNGISYKNTKDAEIVEYYDNILEKPTMPGEYNYELKVVYNEKEYDTGISGTFTINKKAVDIVGLKVEDKIYDEKTEVIINKSNVKMQGIKEDDKDYIELEIVDKTNVDTASIGDKTVTLRKDIDYRLKLKENADESQEALINCYELPETLVLNSKIIANESDNDHTTDNPNQPTNKDKTDEEQLKQDENVNNVIKQDENKIVSEEIRQDENKVINNVINQDENKIVNNEIKQDENKIINEETKQDENKIINNKIKPDKSKNIKKKIQLNKSKNTIKETEQEEIENTNNEIKQYLSEVINEEIKQYKAKIINEEQQKKLTKTGNANTNIQKIIIYAIISLNASCLIPYIKRLKK